MHTFSENPAWKSEPNGVFLEPSRCFEPSGCTLVVFGTKMTLGAVLDYYVNQAGGKEEAGHPCAEPPVPFDAVRPVISEVLKVHVSLFQVSFLEEERLEVRTPRLDQVLQLHSQF